MRMNLSKRFITCLIKYYLFKTDIAQNIYVFIQLHALIFLVLK